MDERSAWLAIVRAPGLGAAGTNRLLQHFDNAAEIASASRTQLRQHGVADTAVDYLRNPDEKDLERDLHWLAADGNDLIWRGHANYPGLLEQIPDPPPVLFTSGQVSLLNDPQLAIVGSRNPTRTGEETAAAMALHLARCGLVITSGLARGIDSAAHRGALDAGGGTIAVCGTGPDVVYPANATALTAQIRQHGLLISEFPPGTGARRENFPRRNRIIAGLSLGTLVVEAAQRSGSLITAHEAISYGREVFAIPGSIHNPLARGCHRLIREGARLVESAQDVLSELAPLFQAILDQDTQPEIINDDDPALDPQYLKLLNCIGFEPTTADTVIERSGLTPNEVSSMLLILELRGYIGPSPQGGYSRTGKGI